MKLPPLVRRLLGGTDPTHVYECSACGTSLDDDSEICPTCGGEDISVFQIE